MQLVLVNERDEPVGTMEKLQVHQLGLLHRAFSVFIFDMRGRMLLQKRAKEKYHGGGLWSNACCSHPLPNEVIQNAAERRLREELGFTTNLQKAFEFTYRANVENNLTEYEYDHVFVGKYEGIITPDKAEVEDFCFKELGHIDSDLLSTPDNFTSWFKIAFPAITQWLDNSAYLNN